MSNTLRTKVLNIAFAILVAGFVFSLSTPTVHAADEPCVPGQNGDSTEYCLLAPIPLGEGGQVVNKTDTSQYLKGIFRLAIGLSTALAVIMLIYAGIKYMTTDAFSQKNEAKGIIENAIWGLILALGAWMILYTIDPKLVEFNLSISQIEIPPNTNVAGGSSAAIARGPSYGQPWADDTAELGQLPPGVVIESPSCAKIGDPNCTSLTGASQTVLNGIKRIAEECKKLNSQCAFSVTGGTEYWLHGNRSTELNSNPTDHKPGGNVVDLTKNSAALNDYIRRRGTRMTGSGCSELGTEKYTVNGATFVYETKGVIPHWHVCF